MKTLLWGLCASALLWASCTKTPAIPDESEVFRQKLLTANNAFSIRLLQETHDAADSANAMLSPFSLSVALSIIANGAEGNTRDAMVNAQEMQGLSLTDINQTYSALLDELAVSDPAVELSIASSVWVRQGLDVKTAFQQINQLYYQIPVQQLDLASTGAVEEINNWMYLATNGNIQQVINELLEGDGMYVANSLWFNARLKQAFDSTLNTQQPFYLGAQTIPVNMMNGRGMQYGYYTDNEVQIADLPYENGTFSLTIIVPSNSSNLNNLVSNLTTSRWNTWMNGLSYDVSPTLFLPKFQLEHQAVLKPVLTNMGMELAFADNADFSNLTDGAINIADIKHKTSFKVSEAGVLPVSGSSSANTSFSVNKPFVIAVREKASGRIMMIGKIVNPAL